MSTKRFTTPVRLLMVLLVTALLAGCGAGGGRTSDSGGAMPEAVVEDGGMGHPMEDGDLSGEDGRLIIRNKVLRIQVDDTAAALDEVRELTRTHSGTVSNMQVATTEDDWIYHYDDNGNIIGDGAPLRGWVTVRIPTDSYEEFVDAVTEVGTVQYQSEATDDVTQQHVDLSARLENLRAQEARLREFFDAATNVTEMLDIEKELGRIRGEIESLDAQIKFLERQAAMATVSVELTQPRAVVSAVGSWGFVKAITDGIRGAVAVINGIVTAVLATAPLWILGLIAFFPIRAMIRRRRAAAAAPVPVPAAASVSPAWSAPSPAEAEPEAPEDQQP